MNEMDKLHRLNQMARESGERYPKKRSLFQQIVAGQGRHFTGVVGSRGVGKTVLLRQLLLELENAFYLSADSLRETGLFETARVLSTRYGVTTLLVDEIHFQPRFDAALKQIYDYLNLRVVFTSSVSLALHASAWDLSRRVRLVTLHPFTFGEYVQFKHNTSVPPLTLEDVYHRRFTGEHLRWGHLFQDYLAGGLFPFSLEEPEPLPLLDNVLHKVVERDIPTVANLAYEERQLIDRTVRFIGQADVDGISFSSLSRNVGITKYKAQQYVSLLQGAYVLNCVFPVGANVLREPKVLMYVPYRLLFRTDDAARGGLREDFFAQNMAMRGLPFSYLKTRRGAKTPDFQVATADGDLIIEVGGPGKGRTQFKGITAKQKMILSQSDDTTGIRRPLFLIGFS